MKKKSVWKRMNRGFLVSMVLVAGVLIYVLVSQLMLIPEKQALRELADSVRQISDAGQIQTEETLRKLADPAEQAKALLDEILSQMDGERLTDLRLKEKETEVESCIIDGDTATIRMFYAFTVSGYSYDYNDIAARENGEMKLKKAEDTDQYMRLYLTCKKENGEWKVFRFSEYYRSVDNHNMSFVEVSEE